MDVVNVLGSDDIAGKIKKDADTKLPVSIESTAKIIRCFFFIIVFYSLF